MQIARSIQDERAFGLAWARQWRERNKPIFDAMYATPGRPRCPTCGAPR